MRPNNFPRVRKLFVFLFVVGLACQLGLEISNNSVRATQYSVTVKWTIPSDYSVQISLPTGLGEIDFTTMAGKNFTVGADGQSTIAPKVYAMNITNIGNANVYVRANFSNQSGRCLPKGVVSFNLSTSSLITNMWYWGQGNGTSQILIASAMAPGANKGFMAWSSGLNAVAGTTTKTLLLITAGS